MKNLETDRLLIRPFTFEDVDYIVEQLNEPSFIQNIGDRNVRNTSDAKDYLEKGPIASYTKNGFGLMAVVLKETEETIGMCGLIKRSGLDDIDIGFAFLPKFWSKGYAIESAESVMQNAKEIGLKRVVAIVDPKNEGSIRVLEKLGMTFEKMVRLSEDDIDLRLFVIDL